MIQLGYYNRQLSVLIFLVITAALFIFYIYFLRSSKNVVVLILLIMALGIFSYPAFSHDIFNYIFDARIVVFHHANPYLSTALMFPDDTWTRFMNWTHRTYPYGPIFLPLTILVYLLGFNKFLITLVLFKGLMVSAYAASGYLIYKLAGRKGLIFFALNPLIIYEVVVAGHMDIIMLFFALTAIYFKSKIFWLLSAGIKYVTVLLFPRLPVIWLVRLAYLGAILQIGSRELLPHYFIVPIGITALIPTNKKVFWFTIIISAVLLSVRYLPYILTGEWLKIALLSY